MYVYLEYSCCQSIRNNMSAHNELASQLFLLFFCSPSQLSAVLGLILRVKRCVLATCDIVICGRAHATAGHHVLRIPPSTFHTYKAPRLQPFRLLRPQVVGSAFAAMATASLKQVGSLVSRLLGAAEDVELVPKNI